MTSAVQVLRRKTVLCTLIVAATLATYAQVGGLGFLGLDDPAFVSDNPHVLQGLTSGGVLWAVTSGATGNWQPLTWISHMLDVEIHGRSPGGHHLTSLLLHVLNALLVFALLRQLTGADLRAGLVAGLFALHPLRVESVAWISERKDV